MPRILPKGLQAEIRGNTWEIPPLFHRIQEWADVGTEEMFRVFNMGIGMVVVCSPDEAGEVLGVLRESGHKGAPIGTVQSSDADQPSVVLELDGEPAIDTADAD